MPPETNEQKRQTNALPAKWGARRAGAFGGTKNKMAAQISSANHRRASTRKKRGTNKNTKRAMRCLRRGSDEMRHDGRTGYGSTLNWQLLRSRSRQIEHRLCGAFAIDLCLCLCLCLWKDTPAAESHWSSRKLKNNVSLTGRGRSEGTICLITIPTQRL